MMDQIDISSSDQMLTDRIWARDLEPELKLVALALARAAGSGGATNLPLGSLANQCGLGIVKTRRALFHLSAIGLLQPINAGVIRFSGSDSEDGRATRILPEAIAAHRRSPAGRASRLPADWCLPDADRDWALEQGLSRAQIDREAARFRDYWLAASGARAAKCDWSATWRNWIRQDLDKLLRAGNGGGASRVDGGRPQLLDIAADEIHRRCAR